MRATLDLTNTTTQLASFDRVEAWTNGDSVFVAGSLDAGVTIRTRGTKRVAMLGKGIASVLPEGDVTLLMTAGVSEAGARVYRVAPAGYAAHASVRLTA